MDKQTLIDRYLRYLATDVHLAQAQALGILAEDEVTILAEERANGTVGMMTKAEAQQILDILRGDAEYENL